MLSNEQLVARYPDLIAPDSDADLLRTVGELDGAAMAAAQAVRPPAALEEAIERMIREHRQNRPPTPFASVQVRVEQLPRQRGLSTDDGRATPFSGPIPPASRGMLPLAHPEPTTIPLPVRTGAQARLRQVAGIAAAVLVFVLVAIMLAQIFGAGGDDDGQQAAPVDPAPSPTVDEILFAGEDADGTSVLYIADVDSSETRQLVRGAAGERLYEAVWSPDGTRIAFSSELDGEYDIYVVDADGNNRRRLTDSDAIDSSPAWSPDGAYIAFNRYENDGFEIYVVSSDGADLRSLTNGDGGLRPAWSPNGDHIAFLNNDENGSLQLFAIGADGSNLRQLAIESQQPVSHTWSPDGSGIAFLDLRGQDAAIYVTSADGTSAMRLSEGEGYGGPVWSPDGQQIAFAQIRDTTMRIYIMDADGSDQRMLIDTHGFAPTWSPDGSTIAFISGVFTGPASQPESNFTLHVVNRDGSGHRVLAENVFAIGPYISWRPTTQEGSVPEPSPTPTSLDDLAARASRSPFPDAEVLHVVQIAEQQDPGDETHTIDAWIDQTTGDAVVWRTTMDGEPRSFIVQQGATVTLAEADVDGWLTISITTTLSTGDYVLPDPLSHLNRFRDWLSVGADGLEASGVIVDPSSSYEGRPAVELIMPVYQDGQVIATETAYLNTETLYPIATIVSEGAMHVFSYPVIEQHTHDSVPAGTFDPPIPDAPYTYFREVIAPEAASDFGAYPLWWLGEQFSGYTLHSIERNRTTTPDDDQNDRDSVSVVYLSSPDDYDDQLRIVSQPPLSDIKWALLDASHNVNGYEVLEIDGHRAWLHPDGWQIEIAFPDSYVIVTAPGLALAAAEALQQVNAPVGLDGEAVQTVEDALAHPDIVAILGRDDVSAQVVSVQRMRLAEALAHGAWARHDSSLPLDPEEIVWELEIANVWAAHSCPYGATREACHWQHLTYLISAETGAMIGLRSADWMLTDTPSDDPPTIPTHASLPTIDDALRHVHALVPGQDGQASRIIGVWLLRPIEAGLGAGWGDETPIWQVELQGGAENPFPCMGAPGVEVRCPADHITLQLHAISGDMLGYRQGGPSLPGQSETFTFNIAPPDVFFSTPQAGQIRAERGSYQWFDIANNMGTNITSEYIPLHDAVPWPMDVVGQVTVEGQEQFTVGSITLAFYDYDANVTIMPDSSAVVFVRESEPVAQVGSTTDAFVTTPPPVPPGTYIVEVTVRWDVPDGVVLPPAPNNEIFATYAFVVEVQSPQSALASHLG